MSSEPDRPTAPADSDGGRVTGTTTFRLTASAVALLIAASTTALVLQDSGSSPSPVPAARQAPIVAASREPEACAPHLSGSATGSVRPAAASPVAATPTSTSPTASTPATTVTYVVKPGDNLTVIAAWFHQHGYGDLYDRNKAVIGADPDLIHPGQRITVSGGGMTVSS